MRNSGAQESEVYRDAREHRRSCEVLPLRGFPERPSNHERSGHEDEERDDADGGVDDAVPGADFLELSAAVGGLAIESKERIRELVETERRECDHGRRECASAYSGQSRTKTE